MTLFDNPFRIQPGLVSRSISFENPTGAPGAGGMEASPLGHGRKGSAVRHVQNGETITLADITGNGTIRHIWLTTHDKAHLLRGALIRIYWEGQKHPSVELPLGEFFGFANGKANAFQSVFHSVSSTKGMNSWLPMPFTKHARIEFVNQSGARLPLFYQIDYTLGDGHEEEVGRLHAWFNRENPTTKTRDLEILPERQGRIRYLGAVLGIRPHDPLWWGEGELKAYIDNDTEFATIVGTGTEDYVGHAFGIQDEAFLHNGCNFREKADVTDTGMVSIYRWHVADPILCQRRMRVTIQQIGHRPTYKARTIDDYKAELFERADDWSSATFWYESSPSSPLPPCAEPALRLAGIFVPPP
ncbi:glycoside hydrolase family 172 protein [Vitreimonas flagellata]|uniref:glycoside hydrolase family 172 protein n=1 Tax=Vitreimonas flagellata TaxID=2560861 RepID=UPI001074E11F|nr:glycoside hydrolase family 172 protein [Vitreimonas flagellata]